MERSSAEAAIADLDMKSLNRKMLTVKRALEGGRAAGGASSGGGSRWAEGRGQCRGGRE
jgi:hypothetical protein